MDLMKFNGNNLDELRHSKQKLEQFDRILEENMKQSYFSKYTSWFSTTIAIIVIIARLVILMCCCCKCSWLPFIGRFFPKHPSYCGLPQICITNHDERFELSDRPLTELRLRHLEELDEANDRVFHYANASSVPCSTNVPITRPRRSLREKRFQILINFFSKIISYICL
ncbi:unnamed protein product [Ceutorhynchus assimilis]|uniref:Uncharacterized protein n=1 Tax=Ceutorhynchus assimilis TaxID=467358 RepID=A0A9N9MJ02_9CUCU|nr:unnamed protein product [Ceutorhynchus assimilis]